MKDWCDDIQQQSTLLRAIIGSIREGVITINNDQQITSFSKKAEQLTSYKASKVIGKHYSHVIDELEYADESPMIKCLTTQKEQVVPLASIRCKTGKLCPVAKRYSPLYNEKQELIGVLLLIEDRRAFNVTHQIEDAFMGIMGNSKAMKDLYKKIKLMGPQEATVLISGESGTGKELIARSLHTVSNRASMPFIAINCAALPEQLLESELFGHVKGAFTGAIKDRKGVVAQAQGGTLFLDEIGELAIGLQAKILRFIQERMYQRIGENKHHQADVRIIAATNRNLSEEMHRGNFRKDLFYRLNVLRLQAPSLKERGNDVILLAHYFLRQFSHDSSHDTRSFNEQVINAFLHYDWPGNVRELQNVVQYLITLCSAKEITEMHLPPEIKASLKKHIPQNVFSKFHNDTISLSNSEKQHIVATIKACNGNRQKAAKRLGMHRSTLFRKMKKYGIKTVVDV